ncbi:MAG: type II toxin-antitoxin system HicA family toxin, partial [Candidatus Nanopelagicales bacterium]|nr:type II toxin-antitoxin system HicA family toxin [Candidatus Nanopelagicales bacterium]
LPRLKSWEDVNRLLVEYRVPGRYSKDRYLVPGFNQELLGFVTGAANAAKLPGGGCEIDVEPWTRAHPIPGSLYRASTRSAPASNKRTNQSTAYTSSPDSGFVLSDRLTSLVVRLIVVRAVEVNRRIESLGGQYISQRGSHRKYRAAYKDVSGNTTSVQTVVPQHRGDIPTGTLAAIQRQMEPAFGKGWLK